MEMKNYMQDGAYASARAVLVLLQGIGDIESSWNEEFKDYDARIKVARWENCREQGYVVFMRSADYKRQINIAFFEHRNSDSICAVKWEQVTGNASPTIESADFGDVYKDKYDTSHAVSYNQHYDMAKWIKGELEKFWKETVE